MAVFAIARLRPRTGIPERTTGVPSEPALRISIAIGPVLHVFYEPWIDTKAVDVPYFPAYHFQSDPVCGSEPASNDVSHFARSFKASFGMSARRRLVERRIDRAKDFLITSHLPRADVALQSGFSDQIAFTGGVSSSGRR
jgi:Helix-turn-helix domain